MRDFGPEERRDTIDRSKAYLDSFYEQLEIAERDLPADTVDAT